MKNRWRIAALSDVAAIQSGAGFPDKYQGQANGVIPFYKVSDMNLAGNEREMVFENNSITEDVRLKLGAFLFPGGSTIFPKIGGAIATNKKRLTTRDCCVDNNVMGVVPKVGMIGSDFLFYFFLKHDLSEFANEAHLPSIKKTVVEAWPIAVPPLPEQQRIVAILDEAFAGIATAKANAEKNLQNARAIFESDLDAVITQSGDDWVNKSIGELVADGALAKPFDGNHGEIHPRKADFKKAGVPFVMASDLHNGEVDTRHCAFLSRKQADSLRVGFAKDGDVLISHKGTIGRSAIVKTTDDYIMLTPQVTAYRVTDFGKLHNRYIRYFFMSQAFQQRMIAGAADGSTRAYIGITKQLSLRLRFPSVARQKTIAAEFDLLLPETQRLASIYERKLVALDALKKSLLHCAFAGELTANKSSELIKAVA